MPPRWLLPVMLDDQRRQRTVRDRRGRAITIRIGKLLFWSFIAFNMAMTVVAAEPTQVFVRLSAVTPATVFGLFGLLLGGLPFVLPVLVLVPFRRWHHQFHAHITEPWSH
jgi:hypothetical protein